MPDLPEKTVEEAIKRLADLMPCGHVQAETDPPGFLNSVAREIKRLRAIVAQAKVILYDAHDGSVVLPLQDLFGMRPDIVAKETSDD